MAGSGAIGECVQIALQDEDGGDLVDDCAVFGSRPAGGMKMTVSLGGGQTLIPEVNGQAGLLGQNLGKSLCFHGLRAEIAGHVKWISDHDLGAGKPADHPLQRFQILTAVGADEGEHWLRGHAHRIRDGNPDAAVADIEPKQAIGGQRIHTGILEQAVSTKTVSADP